MEAREAWAVLGLRPTATREEVRAAYRRLVRRHHPDVVGDGGAATTARINEAWRVLQSTSRRDWVIDAVPPQHSPNLETVDAVDVDGGDTITVTAPADEAFMLLLEAAHRVGDVTHVAPDDGLLEALIAFDDGRHCSLVVSLQGRANGTTDAFCTLQALDARPSPPVGLVVDALVDALTAEPQ